MSSELPHILNLNWTEDFFVSESLIAMKVITEEN